MEASEFPSRRMLLGLWLLSGVALLALIGHSPVLRTQEARVLETGRQMLTHDGGGIRSWLFPTLNDEPRLKKPPLAYWMTATAYRVGGVSETVGRIPTAIIGWLTLGAVYVITSRFFDRRTALASAGLLLATHLFYRFMRSAETDAPATLFITIAIGALWWSMHDPRWRWMHLAAASTALVVLSKGAPAVFVAVFFIAICALERRWDLPRRFLRSGALLTLIAIAVPWFVYIELRHSGGSVLASEVIGSVTGENHWRWPFRYAIDLFIAVAPWSAFLPLALYDSLRRWKTDAAVRIITIWLLAILLPLCINGNKQPHYLLMLMPPVMVLIARFLLTTDPALMRARRVAMICTIVVFTLGSFGVVAASHLTRKQVVPMDWMLGAAILIAVGIVMVGWIRRGLGAALVTTAAATIVLLPALLSVWYPSLKPEAAHAVAAEIMRRYEPEEHELVFYGKARSLLVCFDLRTEILTVRNSQELEQHARPGTILIAESKANAKPPPVPAKFVHQFRIAGEEDVYDVYEAALPPAILPVERSAPGAG